MNDQITIREATCKDVNAIARVHVDSWRTTYRGILPDDFLANLSYKSRAELWEEALCRGDRTSFVFVAEDDAKQVVGFAAGGRARSDDEKFRGELYAIYLLESFQRNGIGRMLTRTIMRRLRQDRIQSMLVWVLRGNPSRAFYESLGATVLRAQSIDIGGNLVEEVAYGWEVIPGGDES